MNSIIIGLGNPGEKFENTPHNIGFEVLDTFAEKNHFPEFVLEKKLEAEIAKKGNIILAKPVTFMNHSGKAAKKLSLFYKSKNIILVHDDKDLAIGYIKIVCNRGSAGHKGVESVIKAVGNKNLTRIRIGIASQKKVEAMKIILKEFSKAQNLLVKKSIKKSNDALLCIIEKGVPKAMNEYNKN